MHEIWQHAIDSISRRMIGFTRKTGASVTDGIGIAFYLPIEETTRSSEHREGANQGLV